MCWDMAVRIGDKGWLILQSSDCWKTQWALPTGRWALAVVTVGMEIMQTLNTMPV